MKTILLVDDEPRIRKSYKDFLTREDYTVIDVDNIMDARKYVKAVKIDLILLDLNMGEYGGELLFEILRSFHPLLKIMVCSVYSREEQQWKVPGANAYFDKSESFSELLKTIRRVLREPARRIMIIEDELRTRTLYRMILEKEGYEVITFADNIQAEEFLNREECRIDLFVLDLAMPRRDGCYFFDMIKERFPEARVMVASNYPLETQQFAVFDAQGYFDKTDSNSKLVAKVKQLLETGCVQETAMKGGGQ